MYKRQDLSLPDFHLAILPYDVPNSREEALFSAPWCAAVALATGACVSWDFTPEGIAREDIRALTARTTAKPRKPINPKINLDPSDPDTVTVTLADGSQETAAIDLWTGAPGKDLSREKLRAKFDDNCSVADLDIAKTSNLAEVLCNLSSAKSINGLMQSLNEL